MDEWSRQRVAAIIYTTQICRKRGRIGHTLIVLLGSTKKDAIRNHSLEPIRTYICKFFLI